MSGQTWNGRRLVKAWVTPSSSGSGQYRTALWDDETLSCDCMGWRIKKEGHPDTGLGRSCKHTLQVRQFGATLDGATVPSGTRVATAQPAVKKAKLLPMQPASRAVMDEIQARSAFLEIP
jgi:hypothetical protein